MVAAELQREVLADQNGKFIFVGPETLNHMRQPTEIGWYGTMIDIEEQKQAEAALPDRERGLSQLVDMVPSHLWRLTPDGAR